MRLYISRLLIIIYFFLTYFTVYLEDGQVVLDTIKLYKRYTGKFIFVIDVLSILPTDILYLFKGSDFSAVRLNRILRAHRISTFFDKTDSRSNFPYAFRASQLMLYILLSFHWNACFYYQVSAWIGFCADKWVYVNNTCEDGLISDSESLLVSYTYSFYWSILTLTTMGDVGHPVTVPEFGIVVLEYLVGILIFGTIIGNVSDIISSMNSERAALEEKIDGVKQYMTLRGVSKDLEKRVTK